MNRNRLVLTIIIALLTGAGVWWYCQQGSSSPVPLAKLRKDLNLLDEKLLEPYRVEVNGKQIIDNQDLLEVLGTKDYLMWELDSGSIPEVQDRPRYAGFWITFYNRYTPPGDENDIVYFGGDSILSALPPKDLNPPVQSFNTIEWERYPYTIMVPGCGDSDNKVPVELFCCKHGTTYKYTVVTYRINNKYCDRLPKNQKSIFKAGGYFSRVDLQFGYEKNMDKKIVIEETQKLAQKLLPILYQQHWPQEE